MMQRIWHGLVTLLAAVFYACSASAGANAPARMVILGVDGMDPKLLAQYMQEGVVPNLSRLASTGGFMPLQTSMPPQSPVAWSTFITGMDPGSHGIFDFLHLDRDNLTPYMSTTRIQGTSLTLPMGRWRIPLKSPRTELLRQGTAFWELLEKQRRAHAALPDSRELSARRNVRPGDLRHGDARSAGHVRDIHALHRCAEWKAGTVSGGIIEHVSLRDGVGHGRITGPPNPLLGKSPNVTADLEVMVDRQNPVALVRVGDGKAVAEGRRMERVAAGAVRSHAARLQRRAAWRASI